MTPGRGPLPGHRVIAAIAALAFASVLVSSCTSTRGAAVQTGPMRLKGMLATWNERMKAQGSHARAGTPEGAWFTPADVVRLKAAGANCIEIHQMGLPELMPERGAANERFFTDFVDHWVDWCAQNRMYCILTITGMDGRADWAFYLSMPAWLWDGYPLESVPGVANTPDLRETRISRPMNRIGSCGQS